VVTSEKWVGCFREPEVRALSMDKIDLVLLGSVGVVIGILCGRIWLRGQIT
jgi:hypothetical protein